MNKSFDKLINIMRRLRGKGGCPWDRKQNFSSIRINLLEETYETIDAINKKNYSKLKEELGDLLLQVVFLSQMADEKNKFTIYDVINEISEKLIRRHPHVFNNLKVKNTTEVLSNWENIKRAEKSEKEAKYILNDIPQIFPGLLKAYKVQNKVKRFGFNWGTINESVKRFKSKEKEFLDSIKNNKKRQIEYKFGELIFSIVNIGMFYKINPEEGLNKTTKNFIQAFNKYEKKLKKQQLNNKGVKI